MTMAKGKEKAKAKEIRTIRGSTATVENAPMARWLLVIILIALISGSTSIVYRSKAPCQRGGIVKIANRNSKRALRQKRVERVENHEINDFSRSYARIKKCNHLIIDI